MHFARFGEHYTKPEETKTVTTSDNSEQEEIRDKEDAVEPTPNLPTGVLAPLTITTSFMLFSPRFKQVPCFRCLKYQREVKRAIQ